MIRILMSLALTLGLASAAAAQEAAPVEVIEMVEGNPEAKVQVVEYASLTCVHCANFHTDQYQKLRENYVDPGKISFTFREVYFDRPGLWASMVARCGGEMRYHGIIDMLMEQQRDWIGDGQGAGIVARLRKIGLAAGLSEAQLDACMQDGAKAQALVDWFEENAKADDIKSTPSFVVNGTKYGNMSYEHFAALLDELLAE